MPETKEAPQGQQTGGPSSFALRGAGNVAKMTVGRLATQFVLVASAFIISRTMGPDQYGLYSAIMAIIAIAMPISTVGLRLVELRYLAPAWADGNREDFGELASTIWTTRLFVGVAAGGLVALWLALSRGLGVTLWVCLFAGALFSLRSAFETTQSLLVPASYVGRFSMFELLRASLTLGVVLVTFHSGGLDRVFAALPVLYAALLVACLVVVLGLLPLRPFQFRWASLRPHFDYGASSFVGGLADTLQSQFAIYVLAAWVTREEAGFLAFTLQILAFAQVLFLSTQNALMPLLAELESRGQMARLRQWGGLLMRYAAAGASLLCIGWSLLGRDVIGLLLGSDFAPVAASGTVILLAAVFFCCGSVSTCLLYVRGLARAAAGSSLVHAAATIAGVVLLTLGSRPATALEVAMVYAAAALVFWGASFASLGLLGRLWLPLGRVVLLFLPVTLALPLSAWDAGLSTRLGAAAGITAVYCGGTLLLGLLPLSEVREIVATFRGLMQREDGSPDE